MAEGSRTRLNEEHLGCWAPGLRVLLFSAANQANGRAEGIALGHMVAFGIYHPAEGV